MTRLGFLMLLTFGALGMLSERSDARGGRGGGFRGGGRHMGSVRHSYYYRPRSYARHETTRGTPDHSQGAYHRAAHAATAAKAVAWGTRVRRLPDGYRRRWWRNRFWYYGTDMWYVEDSDEYIATQPPLGMIVHAIPEGSVEHTVDGRTYYEYNGVWFRPVMSGGGSSYEVVSRPEGS